MKVFTKEINSCHSCPMYRHLKDEQIELNYCWLTGRLLSHYEVSNIPDWCALPDKQRRDSKGRFCK